MDSAIEQYKIFLDKYSRMLQKLDVQYNYISGFRLMSVVLFITMLYLYFRMDFSWSIFLAGIALLAFIVLINIHGRIVRKRSIHQELVAINAREISYLVENEMPFENGSEYTDPSHFYSYDLDVFGPKGLYQNLNRTTTVTGKDALAKSLLTPLSPPEIKNHQSSIAELSSKIEWRQHFAAIGHLTKDKKSTYERLLLWSTSKVNKLHSIVNTLSYVLPVITIALLVLYVVTNDVQFRTFLIYSILVNLLLLGRNAKAINLELENVGLQHETLKNYSSLFQMVEYGEFEHEMLKEIKEKLSANGTLASKSIEHLAKLLNDLESMRNVFGALFLNGLALYHLHSYRRLLKWKANNARQIGLWMQVVGQFESLNSLANFAFNNTDFIYPQINSDAKIQFSNLAHPLIDRNVRVANDIDFSEHRFVILTGSNMSGKSTFLRTLGINMILGGVGSPVCASKANIHPMPILLSMRLSDSLSDSESYFYAEVKRLKAIMDKLEEEKCFVLLDEILRGTNSDDKRAGTMAVIRNIVDKGAIGVIATHDLEVCSVTNSYPDVLVNKRFEVEIENDELVFDYKLKEGICKNRNASFLMKKMGVI